MKYDFVVLTLVFYISVQLSASAIIKDSNEFQTRPKKLVMPVLIQKMGGSWKPELTEDGEPTWSQIAFIDAPDAQKENQTKKPFMPVIAQKAGGTWKHESNMQGKIQHISTGNTETSEQTDSSHQNSEYWSEEYDDEEIECPQNTFLHARSKLCVPYKCRRGTSRNKETGQCLKRYVKPPPYNNYIDYEYRPSVKRAGPLINPSRLSYKRG